MLPSLGLFSYLKIVVGVIAVTAVGLFGIHYIHLTSKLEKANTAISTLQAEKVKLEDLANENAAAALKADADRRAAIDALETLQSGLSQNAKTSRLAQTVIDQAPETDNGPVSPLLERLRQTRFGGGQ